MELTDKFLGLTLSMLPADLRAKLFDGIDPVELGTVVFDHKTDKVCLKRSNGEEIPFITIPEYKKLLEKNKEVMEYLKKNDFLYETT